MSNILKTVATKTRDKWFAALFDRLRDLQHAVDQLEKKISTSERVIQESQLKINHTQSLVADEIRNRVKNSGVITLSETELLVKIFSGLKMYLDPRDHAITPHLALDGIWEHRITAAWLKIMQPNFTVLDIGANNGYYGALAAQHTDKKQSKIVQFEANPQLIPYIRRTLNVNWLNEQTTLENLAVSDRDTELTLHVLKDYVGSSSVRSNKDVQAYMKGKMTLETAQEVKVKATSIDNYCKKHTIKAVDLIIMDIEGYEDTAYAGMRQTIAASPNATLFIEFTPGAYKDARGFYGQMLKDFGHVYVLNDDGGFVSPKDTSYNAVIGDADDWVMPIFSKNANLAKL
jgi:FkbM family methyltransferase